MDNSYDIRKAFEAIESELIQSMIRNMAGHRDWEIDEGFDWSQWQVEKLREMHRWRLDNEDKFGSRFMNINQEIEDAIRASYKYGGFEQERAILRAIKKGYEPVREPTEHIDGQFFGINDRKLEVLVQSVKGDMETAEQAVLRMANDQYRKGIYNAQVYANSGAGTLWQAVDMATKSFLERGINCIEYKNGNQVNIASYSEMAVRTANKRAYLQGEGSKRHEWGEHLVVVHARHVACPNCLQWLGKVYVDDVWSGGIPDGKHRLISEAMAGGLYHPNCKDIHSTYFEGISEPPKRLSAAEEAEAARVYDLQQEQRYNERMIRRHKRVAEGSLDPDAKNRALALASAWDKKQQDFLSANSDVLRRAPNRESIRGLMQNPIRQKRLFVGDESMFFSEDVMDALQKEFGKLQTNEVVITGERAVHIASRHPDDYEYLMRNRKTIIEDPTLIVTDPRKDATVKVIRKSTDKHSQLIVRLSVDTETQGLMNSVITGYRMRDKNLKKSIRHSKLLFERER